MKNYHSSSLMLHTDLDNLAKWCDMWQLNFNATKCKVIHFSQATHSYGDYYLNGVKTWASYLIQD